MVNRQKRLEKGIESLKEIILEHEEKMKKSSEEGNIERMEYYQKEISGLKKTLSRKEEQSAT